MEGKQKQIVKIAYADMWRPFSPEKFGLINILGKEFELIQDEDDPDILVCSIFGMGAHRYQCPRIQYIGEATSPDFATYDYCIGFDRLSFPKRYLRLPLYLFHNPGFNTMALTRNKHKREDSFYKDRDKFCAYIVSAGSSNTGRDEFFRKLCERKHVDSAGGHLNNMPNGERCGNKLEFLRDYRFCIAFENNRKEGYVTEKITEALAAGCIPIYYGDPTVELDFNKGSFINVADFASFDECIDYVLYVDEHPEEYEKIIRTPAFSDSQNLDLTFEDQLFDFFHSIVDEKPPRILRSYPRFPTLSWWICPDLPLRKKLKRFIKEGELSSVKKLFKR